MRLSPFRTRKCETQASFLLKTQDVKIVLRVHWSLTCFCFHRLDIRTSILPSEKIISPVFSCASTQNCISSLSTAPGLTWGFQKHWGNLHTTGCSNAANQLKENLHLAGAKLPRIKVNCSCYSQRGGEATNCMVEKTSLFTNSGRLSV